MTVAEAVDHIAFTTADLVTTRAFYRGLGFVPEPVTAAPVAEVEALGVPSGGAARLVLRLGAQRIAFLRFDPPGRPYPAGSTSTDLWFQHIAIPVADMASAHARVMALPGVVPITRGGPQRLPADTGGVTAFKFRDPEGHPLELLAFPSGIGDPAWQARSTASPFLGIDHSAIAVGDLERSSAWYEALGFSREAGSFNRGPAQARLDDVAGDRVDVRPLASARRPTPHLELLAYRTGPRRPIPADWRADDVAATRTVLRSGSAGRRLLRDPDGHLVVIEGTGAPVRGLTIS